jgi:hypothetical protein
MSKKWEHDELWYLEKEREWERAHECSGLTLYGLTTMGGEADGDFLTGDGDVSVCNDQVFLPADWLDERIAAGTLKRRCFGLTKCSPAYDELPRRYRDLFDPRHA